MKRIRNNLIAAVTVLLVLPVLVSARTLQEHPNSLGSDIPSIVGRVIRVLTGVSGSIALLMFVYGGFLWLTSAGDTNKIAKGKKVFIWSTVGLFLIFGSYAILVAFFAALEVAT